MTNKELQKQLQELQAKMELENRGGEGRRARSVTVGTSFGGTTELMMRGNDGNVLWTPMQPVEVIELIHQLAANVGCHLQLKPREDFSSWRQWKDSDNNQLSFNNHPPFVSSMAPAQQIGISGDNDVAVQSLIAAGAHEHDGGAGGIGGILNGDTNHVVATEKTVNRRSAKRASKAP